MYSYSCLSCYIFHRLLMVLFSLQMIVYMITNIISFFSAIGLAIFVGLFYNLWKVPMKAYENGKLSRNFEDTLI